MKIALCLSGKPRNIDSTFSKIKKTILDKNDVDIFIHTWFDKNNLSTNSVIPDRIGQTLDSNAIEKLSELYNPQKFFIEEPREWNRKYYFPDKCFIEGPSWALDVKEGIDTAKKYLSNMTNSMFYSIMMSNLLKEDYSIKNKINYDLVIRCRTDFSPHQTIDFKKINLKDDEIICHSTGLPYEMPHDWFAIGSTESMNVYSGVYNHINNLHKQSNMKDGWWCNELLIKHHLNNNNIKIKHENLFVYRG